MAILKKIGFLLTGDEKKKLLGLTAGSITLAFFETVSIGLIIPIMGLFMSDTDSQASSLIGRLQGMTGLHDRTAFLTVLIFITMAVFLFKSVYSISILRFQYRFISGIYCRLAEKVMSSYLYRPYSFHLDNNSSALFKNMINEVGQFTSGFLSPTIVIASETMVFSGILILLLCVYPLMTAALVAILLAVMLPVNFFINRKVKRYSRDREIYNEAVYQTAAEALGGIKEIQVGGVQDHFIGRFARAAKKYQDSFTRFNVLSGMPRYILETVIFLIMLTVLLASLYLRRPAAELIQMIAVMGAASIKLLPSVNKIYLSFNSAHYFANSLDIVYSILKDAGRLQNRPLKVAARTDGLKEGSCAFRMERVRFSYKDNSPTVLDGVDISIAFSSITAIAGASGTGKTTLIDILTGLLAPSCGTLYYRDAAVMPENVPAMRKKIGYVPQQIFLIDDTIAANIAFGVTEEQMDRMLLDKAIKMVNLGPFLQTLPEGARTTVGERGVRLSGGQRQRIGIARALYRNPEILILDEATSALDSNSEAEIIDAIRRMKDTGMAVVIVAHRPSTISNADLIYVMDRGRVAARGGFEDLLRDSAIFKKILNSTGE